MNIEQLYLIVFIAVLIFSCYLYFKFSNSSKKIPVKIDKTIKFTVSIFAMNQYSLLRIILNNNSSRKDKLTALKQLKRTNTELYNKVCIRYHKLKIQ